MLSEWQLGGTLSLSMGDPAGPAMWLPFSPIPRGLSALLPMRRIPGPLWLVRQPPAPACTAGLGSLPHFCCRWNSTSSARQGVGQEAPMYKSPAPHPAVSSPPSQRPAPVARDPRQMELETWDSSWAVPHLTSCSLPDLDPQASLALQSVGCISQPSLSVQAMWGPGEEASILGLEGHFIKTPVCRPFEAGHWGLPCPGPPRLWPWQDTPTGHSCGTNSGEGAPGNPHTKEGGAAPQNREEGRWGAVRPQD